MAKHIQATRRSPIGGKTDLLTFFRSGKFVLPGFLDAQCCKGESPVAALSMDAGC
jgi:hypothetical protein